MVVGASSYYASESEASGIPPFYGVYHRYCLVIRRRERSPLLLNGDVMVVNYYARRKKKESLLT